MHLSATFVSTVILFLVFGTAKTSDAEVEQKILVKSTDVIPLNVGGQIIVTTRSTLTRVNGSILSTMFNGRWEKSLSRDRTGRIFLDFNPSLFLHLIDQLRLAGQDRPLTLSPLALPSLIVPFKKMLRKLGLEFDQPQREQPDWDGTAIPDPVTTPLEQPINVTICAQARWNPTGITVAGGHGQGSTLNQLDHPMGIFVDDDLSVYVADTYNHRIVRWRPKATRGQIVTEHGNQSDVKNFVSSVVVDENGTIYLCDRVHNRVERWIRGGHVGETVLANISCWGLALDKEGNLYISGHEGHRIVQWPSKETVAGGHGEGNDNDQLSNPYQIVLDTAQSIYIADYFNHRIVKWFRNSEEGLVVAGGQGYGNGLHQLKLPHSLAVDTSGTMYIVDFGNDRILRWFKYASSGVVIIGKEGSGNASNQLSDPYDIALDKYGNLYVADTSNHRIQMFKIDLSLCPTDQSVLFSL